MAWQNCTTSSKQENCTDYNATQSRHNERGQHQLARDPFICETAVRPGSKTKHRRSNTNVHPDKSDKNFEAPTNNNVAGVYRNRNT